MLLLKAFFRTIQEFVERRVLGSYLQQFIWSTRHLYKKNWAQNFLDTSEHPHRKQIFEALYEFENLGSVLDLGCGPGANIVAIRKKFSDIDLIGVDINSEAIKVGRAYFASKEDLKKLKDRNCIAFEYIDNPNGSSDNIAGILSKNHRVLGMMPHPERHTESAHGCQDGYPFFKGLLETS